MVRILVSFVYGVIYIGNIVGKNRRERGEKKHPVGLPRDASYSWRMGRDSNPRWSCPHNGFQDRRNRPLCHPSKTFSAGLSNLRFCSLFAPGGAVHHSFTLDSATLVLLTRMQDRRNRPLCHPSKTAVGNPKTHLTYCRIVLECLHVNYKQP